MEGFKVEISVYQTVLQGIFFPSVSLRHIFKVRLLCGFDRHDRTGHIYVELLPDRICILVIHDPVLGTDKRDQQKQPPFRCRKIQYQLHSFRFISAFQQSAFPQICQQEEQHRTIALCTDIPKKNVILPEHLSTRELSGLNRVNQLFIPLKVLKRVSIPAIRAHFLSYICCIR